MYRPEGFKNPHGVIIDGIFIDSVESKSYEAGADAMLEGLKKQPKIKAPITCIDNVTIMDCGKGWLVFIPD